MTSSPTSAVVTGASRNIGAAIALRLAADGFPVAINYYSEREKSDALDVQSEIRSAGGNAEIYQCDVSKSDQVEEMFAALTADLGAPSVLVNNAATSVASAITFREIDEAAQAAKREARKARKAAEQAQKAKQQANKRR